MKQWTIRWTVDGASGRTTTCPCTKAQALDYFWYQFATYGYKLVAID